MTCLWSGARRSRSCIIIIHMDDPVLWRKVYLDYSNNLLFTLFTFSGQNFSAFTQCMYLFKANTLTLVFKSSISSLSVYIKGSLILEDILTLVPLPTKKCRIPEQKTLIYCLLFWAGNPNFLLRVGIWHLFLALRPKYKISSEIMPSLVLYDQTHLIMSNDLCCKACSKLGLSFNRNEPHYVDLTRKAVME